ncbi:DUF4190 domain-containing protein [Corynebacterium godavarianum]|uniref:DUF4190 domain-containing protein n=1 Tax=Corynebacterium godavarianum TaxID=2054421 RepID=A0ABY3E8P6_9CORY|nr:DUF4190 domain-containing protein [Corynebacterium godavarianum]MBL7286070.1 DUF4190 domain-containing protein [Corynebacterium godavarianum]TSJ76216.1 DUF4190 domain-containing protein [Corynebacterium godavarianum]
MTDRYNPNQEGPYNHPEGFSDYGQHPQPGQPQPGQPGQQWQYGGAYPQGEPYGVQKNNGMAIAALIVGILAMLAIITIVGGVFLGVIAIILGILGIRSAKKITGPGARKGMAIAGIVLGALALLLSVVIMFVGVGLVSNLVGECDHLVDDTAAYEKCVEDVADREFG